MALASIEQVPFTYTIVLITYFIAIKIIAVYICSEFKVSPPVRGTCCVFDACLVVEMIYDVST